MSPERREAAEHARAWLRVNIRLGGVGELADKFALHVSEFATERERIDERLSHIRGHLERDDEDVALTAVMSLMKELS